MKKPTSDHHTPCRCRRTPSRRRSTSLSPSQPLSLSCGSRRNTSSPEMVRKPPSQNSSTGTVTLAGISLAVFVLFHFHPSPFLPAVAVSLHSSPSSSTQPSLSRNYHGVSQETLNPSHQHQRSQLRTRRRDLRRPSRSPPYVATITLSLSPFHGVIFLSPPRHSFPLLSLHSSLPLRVFLLLLSSLFVPLHSPSLETSLSPSQRRFRFSLSFVSSGCGA